MFSGRDIVRRDGLPLTSVERTVADVIRAGIPEDQVRDDVWGAHECGLSTPEKCGPTQPGGRE